MATTETWTKDPQARLDYVFDWSDWVPDGDSIISYEVLVTPQTDIDQLVVDESALLADQVVVWMTAGKLKSNYSITCRVTTSGGRIDDRTRVMRIVNK